MGRTTATIRDIDPEREPILRLDRMDCLLNWQTVQRIKKMQPDGTLVDTVNAKFREIQEFKLKKSDPAPYRMSLEGERVRRALGCMSDRYRAMAREENMPEDLLQRTVGNNENNTNGSTEGSTDEDTVSIATTDINYCKLVAEGSKRRAEMESLGRSGQEKQAGQVNSSRGRGMNNAECIGKWTVCTLAMPNDRSTLTPNNLPVLVCGVIYYNKSKTYRYR